MKDRIEYDASEKGLRAVLKESIGFIFNRVWRGVKRECLHQSGIVSTAGSRGRARGC